MSNAVKRYFRTLYLALQGKLDEGKIRRSEELEKILDMDYRLLWEEPDLRMLISRYLHMLHPDEKGVDILDQKDLKAHIERLRQMLRTPTPPVRIF